VSEELPSGDVRIGSDELLPELNCFFINGERHDRDRIELQFGFDGLVQSSAKDFRYDVDVLFFLAKTFGVRELGEGPELRQEFQSYVRLHTHSSNPDSSTSLARVRERLNKLTTERTTEGLRFFAIEFDSYIRAKMKRIRKALPTATTDEQRLGEVMADIERLRDMMAEFRKLLADKELMGKRAEELPEESFERNLLFMNEYLSQDYVQFITQIHAGANGLEGAENIFRLMESLAREEALLRADFHLPLEERRGPDSSADFDRYPRRISILKKYFQKTLFVDVSGTTLQNRMLIPVYAISAGFAALWVILLQIYQTQGALERLGINSMAFISLIILAYAARDVSKEWARRFFFKTSSRWFPDYEKTLFVKRGTKKKELGEIGESLRIRDSEELPEDLLRVRYSVPGGDIERYLHEDVLHYRKRVELDLSVLDTKDEFPWGLREILRFRFDRLTPNMEDPFKPLHLLSGNGRPAVRQGHRVYHVYVAAWVHRRNGEKEAVTKPAFKAFLVTLDKSGVLDCKSVKWKKQFGLPPVPPA